MGRYKYKTAEEAQEALKESRRRCRAKHLEQYTAYQREKYKQDHPERKVYKKRPPPLPLIQCRHVNSHDIRCTRKVRSAEESVLCWQHNKSFEKRAEGS